MKPSAIACLFSILVAVDAASAQRVWYLKPDRFDGNWNLQATGGYDDGTPLFDGRY